MPFGRRYGKRRFTGRRGRFVPKYTKRKIVKGYLRKKARKGNTIVSKMKTVCKIAPNDMVNGCKGSFVNPYLTFSGVSGATGPPSDWTSYENLYDSYRICAIKLKWIPNVNNISFGVSGAATFVNGYMPGYLAADYDDAFADTMPTVTQINEYENCKSMNLYRPWKRYFRVPKYTSNPNSNVVPQVGLGNKGYFNLRVGSDESGYPNHGRWMFITEAADFVEQTAMTPANEGLNVGTLIITTYAAFKNRR